MLGSGVGPHDTAQVCHAVLTLARSARSTMWEDFADVFIIPDPDFASKLIPFCTLSLVIGSVVMKVCSLPSSAASTECLVLSHHCSERCHCGDCCSL